MSLFKIVSVLATATLVAGHGYISGINANGKQYVQRMVPIPRTTILTQPATTDTS